MRRHRGDDRNRGRRRVSGGQERRTGEGGYGYRPEEVGRPADDDFRARPEMGGDRGMAGYGGGGGFGGMGYPMSVGGHGSYVAGHRPIGTGYGPGGEAYRDEPRFEQPYQSRDWAPYRSEADWPRRQHVGHRGEGPGQQQFDRGMARSYGGGGEIPRWSSEGERKFRGRGPRDYRRSDERILEDVCDRLTEDDEIDASDIAVRVEVGEVTLEGSVDDRRLKWLAEEIACRCPGVKDVHNHLRVVPQQGERETDQPAAEMPRRNGGRGQQTQTAVGAANRTDR